MRNVSIRLGFGRSFGFENKLVKVGRVK